MDLVDSPRMFHSEDVLVFARNQPNRIVFRHVRREESGLKL